MAKGKGLSREELMKTTSELIKPSRAGVSSFQRLVGTELATPARELPVAKIRPNRYQPRTSIEQDDIESTAESIKATRLIEPIVVRELPDGEFEVMSGDTRFAAVVLLGNATILAIVRQATDKEARVISLVSNVKRKDLADYEIGKSCVDLLSGHDVSSVSELARMLGLSRQAIHRNLDLANLPSEVTAILNQYPRAVGGALAGALKELCEAGRTEEVAKAVQMVADGHLRQSMIPMWVKGQHQPVPPTAKQDLKSADGRIKAVVKMHGRRLGVNLKCDRKTTHDDMLKLQERIAQIVREIAL